MPQTHGSQYKRKPTGGTKRAWRGKRAFEAGSEPTETTLGPLKQRRVSMYGGGTKVRIAVADWAVVTDKTSGKSSKSKLLRVVRNPANVGYQRNPTRKVPEELESRGWAIEAPWILDNLASSPGQFQD